MTALHVDVCIAGGGPAGAAAALRLAALGHRVCVIERRAFPRPHVGESLTPGVWPSLDQLGVRAAVEAAGVSIPSRDAVVRWAEEDAPDRGALRAPGLLVDRGRFDAVLLGAAAGHGALVLQPAEVRDVARAGGGWRVEAAGEGGTVTVEAQLVADAGGRAGVLPGERRPTSARTLALYGYWRGPALPDTTQVEAGADGWFWGAPLPGGLFNAMAFVDHDDARVAGRREGMEIAYRTVLEGSRLLGGLVSSSRAVLVDGANARDATAYAAAEVAGDGWIKLGEAAHALDPLSSTGVEQALRTALVGSVVLHTMLVRPERTRAAAALYRDRVAEAVARHAAWSASHYGEVRTFADRPFWQRRAPRPGAPVPAEGVPLPGPGDVAPEALRHPEARVHLAAEASLVATACIEGDLVVERPALHHPALGRPVAFVDEVAVTVLLESLRPGVTLLDLVRAWSLRLPLPRALRVAGWLIQSGVLGVAEP